MGFVGSVGFSMEGSGLEKVFETVYGKNTVTHMFYGKTISRALHYHFLVDTVLWMKLIRKQKLTLMNRLLRRLQIKMFQMQPLFLIENHYS